MRNTSGEQGEPLRASESRRLARGAFLVLGLAAAFFLFFQLTKQAPTMAAVNVSADDPYDAIGSFGIQAAAFFALLSVVRCSWWGRGGRVLSATDRLLVVRSEMAAVLAVGVTLAGDLMAMVRHPAIWIGSPSGREYAVLLGVMVILDASIGVYVERTSLGIRGLRTARAWLLAGCSVLVFVAVLALYPEGLRESVAGALFTVLVGIVLLFALMRLLLLALVPESATGATEAAASGWVARSWSPWAAVAVTGAVLGLLLVSAEMIKDAGASAPPWGQLALVTSVFIGLEMTGLLLGFALLRGPVGLSPNERIEPTP